MVRSIQIFLDSTQYAKGRYAVRTNPVILYANIIFLLLKGPIVIKKYITNVTWKVK